jgi:putative colanic acid biosynthesis glycosyltransferase WcaI
MRVLIVSQIFLPEMGALSNRLYPIVRQLVAGKNEVFVATGMPNYPTGIVSPNYRGKKFIREKMDGFTILRTAYLTTPRNQSKWLQLLSYLSFIPAAFFSGLRAGKLDVVFVTSPPLFTVIPAICLAKLRGAKLIFDVRDLWPDELITYGSMRENSLPVRLIRLIERWAYRTSDRVVGTSHAILDTIVERGAAREKTFFLPNGADVEIFHPVPPNAAAVDQYRFGDRFVVMYAGLFGIKHSLEVMLEAAELLREHPYIVFFLIGNGARRDALKEYVREKKLDNVIFENERQVSELPSLLARADLCFAAVRPEPYPKKVISVKVFEYLACERPVVGALSGESARLLRESGGGIVVPPGDSRATADAILALYHDPKRRKEMGRVGRLYIEKNYSRSMWAERLEKTMRELRPQGQDRRAPVRIGQEQSADGAGI